MASSISKSELSGQDVHSPAEMGLVGSNAIPSQAFGKAKAQVPGSNPSANAKSAARPAAIAAHALHRLCS
jgi:hypothetical protein